MQIEQEIDYSDSGSSWASRDTFFGVRGDFGMVVVAACVSKQEDLGGLARQLGCPVHALAAVRVVHGVEGKKVQVVTRGDQCVAFEHVELDPFQSRSAKRPAAVFLGP
jgi:hypothetical protein